jgi:ADP-ribose pyrophosphatase YjhB (NUDIX family)
LMAHETLGAPCWLGQYGMARMARLMMNFVVVYAKPVNTGIIPAEVLVVRKDRPEWQVGRYNLVGGKIEDGETPEQCAIRELKEESGLVGVAKPCVMGAICGTWGTVYCVRICVFDKEIKQHPDETEEVAWKDWNELRDSPLLIPNLRVVIPLMMTGVSDWLIQDEGPSWKQQLHTIQITVNAENVNKNE